MIRATMALLATVWVSSNVGCVPTIVHEVVEPRFTERSALDPAECRRSMRYAFESLELVPMSDPATSADEVIPAQTKSLGLDPADICTLQSALDSIADPCRPNGTLLQQLTRSARLCQRSRLLGRRAVMLVREGHSSATVVREMLRLLERESRALASFVFDDSPSLGNSRAEVKVVEFLDFGCPKCRAAAPRVKALIQKYGAVLFIKHYPQPVTHPGSDYAAQAAMAAHRQGRFWPIYTALLASPSLSKGAVDRIAAKAELDMARYERDMLDSTLQKVVARDLREAEAFDVHGTPAFFVNGRRVLSLNELEQRLESLKSLREQATKGGST